RVEIVEFRPPSESCPYLLALRDDLWRIACPARGELCRKIDARHAFHRIDNLKDGKPPRVPAVENVRRSASSQMLQRCQVSTCKVGNVDIVAHAGAVRSRIIGPEYIHPAALAERCLGGNFDQVRRPWG